MSMRISIVITGPDWGKISDRAQRDVLRRGYESLARNWKLTMMRRHFRKSSARRYGHRPRSDKWKTRKLKAYQRGGMKRDGRLVKVEGEGVTDLVLSGDSRRELFRTAKVRAKPTRSSVDMKGPDYFDINFFESSNQPDKQKELGTILASEERVLKRKAMKVVMRELNKVLRNNRRRRKIG